MTEEPTTQELKLTQLERERAERRRAETAPDEDEVAQHERRAEKAKYLAEKLEEREESERGQGEKARRCRRAYAERRSIRRSWPRSGSSSHISVRRDTVRSVICSHNASRSRMLVVMTIERFSS